MKVYSVLSAIIDELNPQGCLADIIQYWSFRTTVPGPALQQASEFLCRRHREHGIQADLLPYAADDRSEWLDGRKNPLEWTPHAASLEIAAPPEHAGRVCSYAQEPLALLSNSTATPPGGITAPVVVMYSGMDEADYQGVDVAGKIIFTDVWPLQVDAMARKHGAVGVITDSVCPPWLKDPLIRQAADVPDLTMWGVLDGHRQEKPLWGFSLTPRQGAHLRQVIRESAAPVLLHAAVDADLAEGTSPVVNAVLPGSDLADEEVWVLSHSSEPGALDDATGCCLSVEIARTLKTLIDRGVLPPLRRTLRFLNAVEVEGYLPYVTGRSSELRQVIAALALDSVGQDFRQSGGRLLMAGSPDSNPSFVDSLVTHLCAAVAAEPNRRFTSDNYDLFAWEAGPCFPGNDNFLADGFFDVPTPMLLNWPDKYYHSNLDTPDKLSANSLGRGGAVAAAYLYLLATAGAHDAAWFAGLAVEDWEARIGAALTRAVTRGATGAETGRLGFHLACQAQDALRQTSRLAPGDAALEATIERLAAELSDYAYRKSASAVALAADLSGEPAAPLEELNLSAVNGPVFRLRRWHLPPLEQFSPAGQVKLTTLRQQYPGIDRAWDWVNGRRSTGEIWERLQYGDPLPIEALPAYLELLVSEGLAEVINL